jgi:hypothetical protein
MDTAYEVAYGPTSEKEVYLYDKEEDEYEVWVPGLSHEKQIIIGNKTYVFERLIRDSEKRMINGQLIDGVLDD